jgi:NAD(P)-dependent dehydrogenase (short-subunit alcohol dehydrogenase family)
MPDQNDAPPILRRLFGLEGHVATVVGGAGRIGSSLCHALAETGAKVCILDTDRDRGELLARQLLDAGSRGVLVQTADATNPAALDEAVATIESKLGPPKILVNAAQFRGSGFYSSSVDDYPLEAWNQVVAVNLTGVYLACQAFGRAMARHGDGRIVNLASTYGVVSPDPRIYGDSGVNSPISYAASKAGVINLTRYLAVHWRERNIRVNCLVPGGVFDQQGDEFVANYCQRTPLGRMAAADDYQGAILFMVSDASRYMTGSVVTIDGGWTAW